MIPPSKSLPPDAQQWVDSIREEWGVIYKRFLAESNALIERGGGSDFVKIHSFGAISHEGLILALSFWGRLNQPRKKANKASSRA